MTAINVLFGIIAMFLIAIGGYFALYDSIPFYGEEESLGLFAAAMIIGALILTSLSILGFSFGWWWFAPLMLLVFAIWQKISYSHWSWLVALGFLFLGFNVFHGGTSRAAWILPLVGKILTATAAFGFVCSSFASLREDRMADKMSDKVTESVLGTIKAELEGGETS